MDIKKIIVREGVILLIFAAIGALSFIIGVYCRIHTLGEFTFRVLSRMVGLGFSCTFFVYPLYLLTRVIIWLVRRLKK